MSRHLATAALAAILASGCAPPAPPTAADLAAAERLRERQLSVGRMRIVDGVVVNRVPGPDDAIVRVRVRIHVGPAAE